MGNAENEREPKNRPPRHKGDDGDPRKQHAPSREGEGMGNRRGHHHGDEMPPPRHTDTDWPPPNERPPSEGLDAHPV